MLTVLIGTDWVANRDAILQDIARDVGLERCGRILIVPELISHDMERRLCEVAGDTCSRFAEVLSFSRLAKRVSDYDGRALRSCLDNGGRFVAMASATKQLHSKLKAYASVETKPEFLAGLLDAVDEFKRCCITPEDLMEASRKSEGSLAQKLEELSLVMESYNSVCARGKCDPRDQMSWLLEELEDSDYGQSHVFYIDGFPDFTTQHMNIIKHLCRVSEDVIVSFTCDEIGSDHIAFEKAGQTAAELKQFAKAEGLPFAVKRVAPRNIALQDAQKLILQGDLENTQSDDITVLQTETIRQECEAALETVLNLVGNGARYRDINIVCGDLSAYRNVLEMLFEKCRIPIYISGTENILEEPAVAAVFAALDAALGDFEQQDVLQYLKSVISPLSVDASDMVENYAVMWGIQGMQWTREWVNHPYALGEKWTSGARKKLEQLNAARVTAIAPLVTLRNGLIEATTLGDEVRALYDFLSSIKYRQKLSSQAEKLATHGALRDAQILNQLWDILVTALEQLYDVLGDTAWEAENFSRLLKLLVTQYDVGTIPPVLDAVSVGPVAAMRCQQCKHLIVLGAQEGALPSYGGESGVLTDQERNSLRKLGVPLTGGSMDGLLAEFADIYGVFNSADSTMFVSCAGGQPSFVYKRLSAMAGGKSNCEELLGSALVNPYDAAAYLLRGKAEKTAASIHVDEACAEIAQHRDHVLGDVTRENIKNLYGQELQLSASQIDRVAQCRLAYFLQYGLFAKERKIAQIDPAEFGTYVHAVLEKTVQEVMELGGFHTVRVEETVGIAKKYSDIYAEERFSELNSDRITYLFKRNWDELELIVRELWEELQDSAFLPVGFEVAFGDGCQVSAVDVSGRDIAAKLRGFVDRVDLWSNGSRNYFRIVDYKTGKKDFDYCDIYNGYGLQMLLYLFALEDSNDSILGENPIPAGVQYFPARVPLVSADNALDDEETSEARKKHWKRKGLVLSQEDVLTAMESSDEVKRMPYTRKKDGTISGDLADGRQFALLKKYVFSKVGHMVDEIASGTVSPNPYTRGASRNACTYCPYGAVCHKLTVDGRRNYQAITDQRFWTDIEKEVGK